MVDDVEANLYVAKGLLDFYGMTVETSETGAAALQKVQSGKVYDIIFMDEMMPGLSGTQTTQKLREMGYEWPIVALTANALIGQAEEFMKAGFDGFISKPIQTMHLNTILTKFIKDKRTEQMQEQMQEQIRHAADDKLGQPQHAVDAGLEQVRHATDAKLEQFQHAADSKLKQLQGGHEMLGKFVDSQKNVASELNRALADGDFKTAHRLAHTLKGLAAMIGEGKLAKAAEVVEEQLKEKQLKEEQLKNENAPDIGENVPDIEDLEAELERVLAQALGGSLERMPEGESGRSLERVSEGELDRALGRVPEGEFESSPGQIGVADSKQAALYATPHAIPHAALFDRLEQLMLDSDSECLELLDELSLMPGLSSMPEAKVLVTQLVRQIEQFDFELALKTLRTLREIKSNHKD